LISRIKVFNEVIPSLKSLFNAPFLLFLRPNLSGRSR
jgi:hypothetical protein